MGKISIIREDGTDYLFAGLLAKELEKHQAIDLQVSVEPEKWENYTYKHRAKTIINQLTEFYENRNHGE